MATSNQSVPNVEQKKMDKRQKRRRKLTHRVLSDDFVVPDSCFSCAAMLESLLTKCRAGTREVHNKLEKNRRAHLKECFEMLKKQLPTNHDDKKSSNLNILHNAIKFIQALRRKEKEYEHEMERLAREKIALQQRHATLKKELSAQWDHIDFNTLIPETAVSDHEEVMGVSDTEELTQRKSVAYSSTSSLSSAATASASASASPHLPHSAGDDRHSPRAHLSPKHIPSDGTKLISMANRLENTTSHSHLQVGGRRPEARPKQQWVASTHPGSRGVNTQAIAFDRVKWTQKTKAVNPVHHSGHVKKTKISHLPVLTSSGSAHIAATIVSPTIQLVASQNLRMLPGDQPLQPLTLSLSHGSSHSPGGVTLMHKSGDGDTLSLVHGNGLRGKGQSISLTIPNGALTTKNGAVYKQSSQSSGVIPGITHVVTPIAGSHGTLVTPVPVTVVSQGTHFLTNPPGKVVTPLNIKPLMSQYLVKPGAAMVVVSQNSQVSHAGSK